MADQTNRGARFGEGDDIARVELFGFKALPAPKLEGLGVNRRGTFGGLALKPSVDERGEPECVVDEDRGDGEQEHRQKTEKPDGDLEATGRVLAGLFPGFALPLFLSQKLLVVPQEQKNAKAQSREGAKGARSKLTWLTSIALSLRPCALASLR